MSLSLGEPSGSPDAVTKAWTSGKGGRTLGKQVAMSSWGAGLAGLLRCVAVVVALSLAVVVLGVGVVRAEDPPGATSVGSSEEEDANAVEIVTAGSDTVDASIELIKTVDGQNALVIPFPISVKYPAASLAMKANGAVIWVTPVESADIEALAPGEEDPKRIEQFLRVMQRVKQVQIYADGPVWLQYGVGAAASTLRADRVFFSILKTGAVDETTGNPVFTLSGLVEGARAHTSSEAAEALSAKSATVDPETGKPLVLLPGPSSESETVVAGGVNRKAAAEGAVVVMPERDLFELEKSRRFFVRAEKLRILGASSAAGNATNAEVLDGQVSTSSLAIPDYSFSSEQIRIHLRGTRRIVVLRDPGLDIAGTRLFTYPSERYVHDLDSRFPITRLDLSSSDAYGYYVRTRFDVIALYDYLWDPEPPFLPFELSPLFEWYEERGMATGLEFRTPRIPTFGSGWDSEFQGHYIGDDGDRRPEVASLGFFPLRSKDRGRFKGWARHRSRDGFAIDIHGNYQSDSTYLQEFFRGEYLSNEQEATFARIRKDGEYRSFYLDVGIRGRDFRDEIERLPVFGFGTYGEPMGLLGLHLTSDGTVGNYRARIAQANHPVEGRQVLRADFRARVERPIDFGIATLVPYAGFRLTAADTRYAGPTGGNPLYDTSVGYVPLAADTYVKDEVVRAQLHFGAAFQTHLARTWPGFSSSLLGVKGMRHILTPRVSMDSVVGPSGRSALFMQMDEVDAQDSVNRVTYSVRNRFQTRRIRSGDVSPSTVDLLDVLLELPTYPNRHRDNGGDLLGDVEARMVANPSSFLQLRAGGFFDPHTWDWQRMYAAAAFPMGDIESTLYARALRNQHEIVGASLAVNLSGTYRLELEQEFDLRTDSARDTVFRLSRSLAEVFSLRLTVRRDAVTRDIAVSFSAGALFGP